VLLQADTEQTAQPVGERELVHGYPPPVRPAGTTVTAYCGAKMTVRGEASPTPPSDTCPECAEIWRRRHLR
jgi:hypothetical protein